MAATLDLTTLPLNKFYYANGNMSAQASDFGPLRDGFWWLQQIYPDAADMGIAVKSHKTGKVEIFTFEGEYHQEGECCYWHFKPVNPKCKVKQVLIYND